MSEKYTGMIIMESLTDPSILKEFEILKTEVVDSDGPEREWNILTVRGPASVISKLSSLIKDNRWYAHFWSQNELIVVFKEKIITDRNRAIKYGKSIGMPEKQLDFSIE